MVTSNGCLSITTVMVPCAMPVELALKPAASTRRATSSGSAVVATSISVGQLQQRIAHRAADHAHFLAVAVEHVKQPRQRAFLRPGDVELAVGGAGVHHRVVPARIAVLDMRRDVSRARRRADDSRNRRSCRAPARAPRWRGESRAPAAMIHVDRRRLRRPQTPPYSTKGVTDSQDLGEDGRVGFDPDRWW